MPQKVGDLSVDEFYGMIESVVKALPKEYFVTEVERIVDKKFEEERKNFWVPAEKHYLHHRMHDECISNKDEWIANHKFISLLRFALRGFLNLAAIAAAVSAIAWVGTVFSTGFKEFLTGLVHK